MTLRGVDLSNHNGPPDSYRGLQWYRDAEFIIAQAIRPPKPFTGWDVGGYTEAQLRAARDDGKKIGIYVWLWNTLSDTKADIRARLAVVPDDLSLDMRPWLDVEDVAANTGPSRQQDVLDALEVMDEWAAARGLPRTGIYSGDWYLSGYMGGWFPEDRMYWLADYGLTPTVLPARPIHQYTSAPVDMNVMLESEIINPDFPGIPQPDIPPDEPDPPPDCATYTDAIARTVNRLQIELDRKTAAGKSAPLRRTLIKEISAELFGALG